MTRRNTQSRRPCAVTIAGSDSGGGAGIQADLKTFAALEVHGTSVLTCVTAQNPEAVLAVEAVSPPVVVAQMKAVFDGLGPVAAKTGMLYSTRLIEAVADVLSAKKVKVVVDPVMVATSGARLLQPKAVEALRKVLLPLATVVTPNLDEAALLTGMAITEPEDLRTTARLLHDRYGCAALVKGGHMEGPEAVDVFFDGRDEWLLRAPRVRGVSSHGTGCTYSAAIAGYLALGCSLGHAVQMAKEYITQAIAQSYLVKRHAVLEHAWKS